MYFYVIQFIDLLTVGNKIQNKNNLDVVDTPTVTEIRKYAHDALI